MRWVLTSFVLFACDARFSDLRPDEGSLDSGMNVVDGGVDTNRDASRDLEDAALEDAALEDAAPEDAAPEDATPAVTVVATGSFEGRGGYDASGRVTLEHLGGDRYALATSDDFATAPTTRSRRPCSSSAIATRSAPACSRATSASPP